MKSRKGEFYITCYNHGEMYLRKDKAGVLQEMRRMLDRYNACPIFKDEYTL